MQILLVEDSPSDVGLVREAIRMSGQGSLLHVVRDGEEAIAFLRRQDRYSDAPHPDLVLLDLNLPRKDGREVLAEIKSDDTLKCIPVVVLTTSNAEIDVLRTYRLGVNCYLTKPIDFEQFISAVQSIEQFWLRHVTLPPQPSLPAILSPAMT